MRKISSIFKSFSLLILATTSLATTANAEPQIINGVTFPYTAPEIENIQAWVNSPPLKIENLKGKVVLIDFWAYSCINCIRTLPDTTRWYRTYRKNGLVIIGVHSPEFPFEKDLANVKMAVQKYHIEYPVALDNDFSTWRNYHNSYWPAEYLINKNGKVLYEHFGEGDVDVTENNIRHLLGISGNVSANESFAPFTAFRQTPETYFGYSRAENFVSPEWTSHNAVKNYSFPTFITLHGWALNGNWIINAEKIVNENPPTALQLHFFARKVFLVAGPGKNTIANIKILLNGKPISAEDAGKDVNNSILKISHHDLYEIINLKTSQEGNLTLEPQTPGVEFYTFTFGG